MAGKYLIGDSEREQCRLVIKEAVEQATLRLRFHGDSYTYHCAVRVSRSLFHDQQRPYLPALEQTDKK